MYILYIHYVLYEVFNIELCKECKTNITVLPVFCAHILRVEKRIEIINVFRVSIVLPNL